MAVHRWHTSYSLWLFATVAIFIGLAFVDPVAGAAKGENSLVAYVRMLADGHYYNTEALLIGIGLRSAFQAIPAVLIGWLLQAIVVVTTSAVRRGMSGEQVADDKRRPPRAF